MSIVVAIEPRIKRVDVSDDMITAEFVDGRIISVPLAWSWRLSDATGAQRLNWELIGEGIGVHWPDIDEDISAQGMLTGVPAHRPKFKRPSPTSKATLPRTGRAARGKNKDQARAARR